MKTTRRTFLAATAAAGLLGSVSLESVKSETQIKHFPDWQEGFLDIHHIATGRGVCAFLIFPDATTMLIDAGDLGEARPRNTMMPHLPDESKWPGEWIADYIKHFSKPLKQAQAKLDYVLLTHFHSDHIGCKAKETPQAHGYTLSGISMVAEHLPIGTLVDRGFPDYDYPSRAATEKSNSSFFNDYLKFCEYQRENRNTKFECFAPGSVTQFALKNDPKKYPEFRIQNIYANGEIWTGQGTETKALFPKSRNADENLCSTALDLSYGAFHYFAGGDIPGEGNRDVETPISKVVESSNVVSMNHHGYRDSMNAAFLAKLKPQILLTQVWDQHHPHKTTLDRMTDKTIYSEERAFYTTGMFPALEKLLGDGAKEFKPDGHVVTRIGKNAQKFEMFVLDSRSKTDYPVILSETYSVQR